MKKVLAISGSLRAASRNTGLLRYAQANAPEGMSIEIADLRDMPFYNADFPTPTPPVTRLFEQLRAADGLLLACTEYNYSIAPALKNALDWASRPAMKSPVKGKPILIMTASPAFTGGVRAQHEMRETLSGMLGRVIARPQVVIGTVHEKIKDGRLVDEAALTFALAAVDDLLAEISLLRAASAS